MGDLESDFNLRVVLVSFKQCLNEKEEVLLDHYLAGWRGLVRCVQGAAAQGRGLPGHSHAWWPCACQAPPAPS